MNRPEWLGIFVALTIGGLVRLLRLPIPAPLTIYHLWCAHVLGMTPGYLAVDAFLKR